MSKPNYRVKMEKHLGRKLKKTEIVHHRDGDSTNDRLVNLEIVSRQEHRARLRKRQEDYSNETLEMIKNKTLIPRPTANELLQRLFTPRQVQLIYKKLYSEKMSKTENEMFSRIIKKRLAVLVDDEVRRIASAIILR
jgi:hypothetical protein